MISATYAALWRNLQAETNVDQLIYEIIGQSQISSTRLPTEPQISQLQQTRKLLLRLKWVFDSQRVSLLRSSLQLAAPIDRQFLLRVILHVMLLAGSDQPFEERNIDYLVFRRIALEALLSVVSLYLFSQSPFTFHEEDLFQSQLQQLVERWQQVQPLSETDSIIVDKIIPAAITAHQEGYFEGNRYLQVGMVEDAVCAIMHGIFCASKAIMAYPLTVQSDCKEFHGDSIPAHSRAYSEVRRRAGRRQRSFRLDWAMPKDIQYNNGGPPIVVPYR